MAAFLIPESYSAEKVDLFQKRSISIRPMVQNQFDYPPVWRDSKEEPYESQSVQELNKSWVISIYIYSSEMRRLVMRVNPLTSGRLGGWESVDQCDYECVSVYVCLFLTLCEWLWMCESECEFLRLCVWVYIFVCLSGSVYVVECVWVFFLIWPTHIQNHTQKRALFLRCVFTLKKKGRETR